MKVINEHLNPSREIKEGVLVHWPEFPDRLYYVCETGLNHCGRNDYCKVETIDHKYVSVLPITELVWDDVDYIEVEK